MSLRVNNDNPKRVMCARFIYKRGARVDAASLGARVSCVILRMCQIEGSAGRHSEGSLIYAPGPSVYSLEVHSAEVSFLIRTCPNNVGRPYYRRRK